VSEGAGKPSYRVLSMEEIASVPRNGLKVASTFSGCGGSCLGYRMAGMDVVWANDCDLKARASYVLNHPGTTLDARDVREVQPADVLGAAGLREGELDVFDGSPPCTSFSTAGRREKLWGKETRHAGVKQRMDDLFWEYARLLRGLMPRVFVAENVSGLAKGVAVGTFKEVLRALRGCGYVVEARLLDAQWLGVPQARQRVIFVGVRSDLGVQPAFPRPLPYRYSIADACPWIARVVGHNYGDVDRDAGRPIMTIASDSAQQRRAAVVRGPELEFVSGFSAGARVPCVDSPSPTIMKGGIGGSGFGQVLLVEGGPSRGAALRRPAHGYFPGADVAAASSPAPTVTALGGSYGEIVGGGDCPLAEAPARARRAPGCSPCPTVLASSSGFSGIAVQGSPAGEGEGFAPPQRRRLSIAEVKRLCSFPDDFELAGGYAQQWARLGNSVPPLMMRAIASALVDGVFSKLGGAA